MATRTVSLAGGNWSNVLTWSEGIVPTAADDVVSIAAGLSGPLTIDAGAVCRSFDHSNGGGTITHNAGVTWTIGDATAGVGNLALKLIAGVTYTLNNATTSAILFTSTSGTQQTVDFAGKTTGNVTFGGGSGTLSYQLTGTFNTGATATVTLTRGTLDTNGQMCSWGKFNSTNSNTRTLTLGASQITLTGDGGGVWDTTTTTNLTLNAGTSLITLSGADPSFRGGGKTYYDITWSAVVTASNIGFTGANTMRNLTVIGAAVKTAGFRALSSSSQTITGTLTLTGQSAVNRLHVFGTTLGTQGTFALSTTGTAVLTNVDFMDVAFTGTNTPVTGTSIGDAWGNSGITFTAAVTRYWVGGTGNWSDTAHWSTSSGGAGGASVPLCHDTVNVDANSGGGTVTADMPRLGRDISFAGFTGTWTITVAVHLYGSVTLGSAMTVAGAANNYMLRGRGSHTLTSNGKSYARSVVFNAVGGTYTLQDAFATALTFQLEDGIFNANGFNVTCNMMNSSQSTTRTLTMGSGTWTLTQTTGTAWNLATVTNLTFNANTSTIVLTDTGASAKTFAGGGRTYNNLSFTAAGTGGLTITGANTFNVLTLSGNRTITFPAGVTTTLSSLVASGAAGALLSFVSSSAGSAATLSDASGTNQVDYVSIKDSAATGGATWRANHSVDVSGNSGWVFVEEFSVSALVSGGGLSSAVGIAGFGTSTSGVSTGGGLPKAFPSIDKPIASRVVGGGLCSALAGKTPTRSASVIGGGLASASSLANRGGIGSVIGGGLPATSSTSERNPASRVVGGGLLRCGASHAGNVGAQTTGGGLPRAEAYQLRVHPGVSTTSRRTGKSTTATRVGSSTSRSGSGVSTYTGEE